MTLIFIVAATIVASLVSLGLAAALSFRWLSSLVDRMVCVSAGLLLTVACTDLLPDAFHDAVDPSRLGWTLLAAVLGFFLLEKMALIHHTHHHEGDEHHHQHGHDAQEARRGGVTILIGDAFHNFADGAVIASAFLLDARAGVLATLAIMAHEIPHEIGDFMILLNAGFSRRKAFRFMLLSGAASVLGGVVGFAVLETTRGLLPYALTIAAASFIYIALSDLLPELMRRSSLAKTVPEVALVFLGVVIGAAGLAVLHGH